MTYHRFSAAATVVAAALAMPAGAQAAGYQEEVLKDGPLTYLPMQDVTATTVPDVSGNDRHGLLAGPAVPIAAGPFTAAGGGLALMGGTVTAGVPARSGSVELWVNPAKLVRGQQAGLVAHGDPKADGWAVGVGAKRKLTFVTGGRHAGSKITLPANVWSMLTVTWDTARVRFVLNGGGTDKQTALPAAPPVAEGGQMTLGGTARGAFSGSYEGLVDEVALYAKRLDLKDMSRHYAAAKLPINTASVGVGGTPTVGQPVVVVPGEWTGTTEPAAYQWQRCDAEGDDCEDIPTATGPSHTVTPDDACSTLRVVETVVGAAGSSATISEASVVIPGPCPGEPGGAGTDGTGTTHTGTAGSGTGDTGAPVIGTPAADAPAAADATAAALPGGATAALEGSATARSAAGTCLRIVSGRRTVQLRRLGILRVRTAGGCITASSPLRITFAKAKGARVASVRYRLGARALRVARGRGHAAAVTPSALRAGVQVLKVRVAARGAKARTVTLKLRLAKA